jgi:hypothetical protein
MRCFCLTLLPLVPVAPPPFPPQSTGLDQALTAASDPNYTGPVLPTQTFVLDLPWWFAGAQNAAAAPAPAPTPEPTAPPAVGVPAAGPYTVSPPTGSPANIACLENDCVLMVEVQGPSACNRQAPHCVIILLLHHQV